MLPAYSNSAYQPEEERHERSHHDMDTRYHNLRGRSDYDGDPRQDIRRQEGSFGGREGGPRDRGMPRRDPNALGYANQHQRERDEVAERFREYSSRGPERRKPGEGRDWDRARQHEYEMQDMRPTHGGAARDSRHGGREEEQLVGREFPRRRDVSVAVESGGDWRASHQSHPRAFRGADAVDSRYPGRQHDRRYQDGDWDDRNDRADLQDVLPSQLDKNKGSLFDCPGYLLMQSR
ncbi:conglutin beta 5-like [Penaeus japonicus]|uniref:conglutin beta 5-like n=1 Tax=Penaeus japonicus TaxID=27405 RepID=UPI001C713831|nr:conglutin beta 5-like [Penaeus japonicus]